MPGARNAPNEYEYIQQTDREIEIEALQDDEMDSDDSGGDFDQFEKMKKDNKKKRMQALGREYEDAEASMMNPNESVSQIRDTPEKPEDDDEELATEINSQGETVAGDDPDGATTQDGKSLAELQRQREM